MGLQKETTEVKGLSQTTLKEFLSQPGLSLMMVTLITWMRQCQVSTKFLFFPFSHWSFGCKWLCTAHIETVGKKYFSPIHRKKKKKVGERLNHFPKMSKLVVCKERIKKPRPDQQIFLMAFGEVNRNSHITELTVGSHHIPSKYRISLSWKRAQAGNSTDTVPSLCPPQMVMWPWTPNTSSLELRPLEEKTIHV